MTTKKKIFVTLLVLVVASILLVACQPAEPETIYVTVEVPGETTEVIVEVPVEDECDNPYLGSCKLDGKGIPVDFFMDVHVRRAFNYCFDWDIYITDVLNGQGVQNVGMVNPGLLGSWSIEDGGPHFSYDQDKCAEEFALAYDGALMETGFRMQIAYNAGNTTRQTISTILANNVNAVSDNFQVEVVALPWPAFLAGVRASTFPIFVSGWGEDIHDAHNWTQPFLVGTYAARQKLPEDMQTYLAEKVSAGVAAPTREGREAIYHELAQWDYDNAIAIRLAVATGRAYYQSWVNGIFNNPIWATNQHFYTVSKDGSADDSSFLYVTIGDSDTLDPAWNYESAGGAIIDNIYGKLVTYAGPDATSFAPDLATDWTVSDDGMTYTFTIRDGVTFHEGQSLTPADVAYTFQRGLLQGGGWSPQWLYTEPFFGNGVYDIAELVDPSGALDDDPEGLQAQDAALLASVCEQVKSQIYVDGDTVVFQLSQPWAPLISTLAGAWGGVINQEWAVAQGAWDGDCATWQNFYGVDSSNSPLRDVANGTGAYMLDHWTPGVETVLTAFDGYWRDEPFYEGGPTGVAAIKTVTVLSVDEWSTRRAMFEAGDADYVYVPLQYAEQLNDKVGVTCNYDAASFTGYTCVEDDATKPFTMYLGAPSTSRTDAFFVLNITP